MSCDIATCVDSVTNQSFYQSIRLQNYTGRDVDITLAILKTDGAGRPLVNKYGLYEISSLDGTTSTAVPTKDTSGGNYTIINGFTAPFNGFVAYTADQQFAGVISMADLSMDSGCCQDYWVSIGTKIGSTLTLINSLGQPVTKSNAFYLTPLTQGMKNAYKPLIPGMSNMTILFLVIILLIIIAVVVGVVYSKYYK